MFLPLRPSEDALVALSRLQEGVAEKMINSCVHAIIVLGQSRNTIKKQDLNKLAFPQSTNYRLIGFALQQANKVLHKTFGMRLYELDDKTKYLLVNADTEYNEFMQESDATCSELAILYFVLMDIFVSADERLTEDEIYNSLKPLDLTKETVKDLLESFVKKLYLQLDRRQEIRSFLWGPRAIAEVDPESFFNRFLDLVSDTSDKNWPDIRKRVDRLMSFRDV